MVALTCHALTFFLCPPKKNTPYLPQNRCVFIKCLRAKRIFFWTSLIIGSAPPRPCSSSDRISRDDLFHDDLFHEPTGMFPPLHGVQITPEQMEHAMRLQLMVSGGFHLHCKPEASTAITPCDNAGLWPSASDASANTTPSPGAVGSRPGSSSSTGVGASTGTGRNANWIIPAPALKLAPLILRVFTVFCCHRCSAAVRLRSVPVLYIALSFSPPCGLPSHQFAYVMSIYTSIPHTLYDHRNAIYSRPQSSAYHHSRALYLSVVL